MTWCGNPQNLTVQIKMADLLFGVDHWCKRLFCASGHVVYGYRFSTSYSKKNPMGRVI